MITSPDNPNTNSVLGAGKDSPFIETLVRVTEPFKFPLVVLAHALVFSLVYWLALFIRFERILPENPKHLFGLPFIVGAKLAVFWALQGFHGWWRYVTFTDLVLLAKATFVSILIFFAIDYFFLPEQISRGAILIDGAFTVAALSALRSTWRLWDERSLFFSNDSNQSKLKRALLVGDDFETAKLAHLINSRTGLKFRVMGLVSLTRSKPKRFSNLRVVGCLDEICDLCNDLRIETVYVPAGKLSGKEIRELIDSMSHLDTSVSIVPSLISLLEGGSKIPIRDVSYEDLLRRDAVKLDQESIEQLIKGRRVLVTGAGGSIGSELCRQILKFQPSQLILLGRGENRVYHIEKELRPQANGVELKMVLASITDDRRIRQVFDTMKPEVVFHAAAHKHVPLMELNIGEAVVNNVYGTMVIADACRDFGVSRCVMVSTDKAVNPTSIMGCTKQLAERYCLAVGSTCDTRFVVTRFGNVLGSEGSVVPLFKKQIQAGGPITVTDPRMTRFFMTIPEAAQLVVQAGAMGKGGEIFVLEMGEPVKIVDLAKDLIRLAGLPANAIEIKFTGIRQGEKLYEELYYRDEKSLPTEHHKILIAYQRPFDFEETSAALLGLVEMAYTNPDAIRDELMRMVPEFKGTPSTAQSTAEQFVHSE